MIAILATYHHSFAGGSKNTSRMLNFLADGGSDVHAFFFESPQYFENVKSLVKVIVAGNNLIKSHVIDSGRLDNYAIAEKIVNTAEKYDELILIGGNLFPYGNIMLDVKNILKAKYGVTKQVKLLLNPVGSDIWQIGPQLKNRVKWLVQNDAVDLIFTYSEAFAREIQTFYGVTRPIEILPPVIETSRFQPLTTAERLARREKMNIDANAFIMHHHSSMRPVKCPEIVIEIASQAAQIISRPCVLIMTGPIPEAVIAKFNLSLKAYKVFPVIYSSVFHELTIYWTGVLANVEFLLQISDLEINSSLHDSFNIAIMEAMASGIPVLCSSVAGICDDIKKSNAGYCFETKKLGYIELNEVLLSGRDTKELFSIQDALRAVVSVANNQSASQKLGENGVGYVSTHFTFDRIGTKFHQMLREL